MLTLHNYWSSVCSQKVRICLAEKNLAFENRHVNLFEFEVLKRPEMVGAARRPKLDDWWQRMQARPAFKTAFAVKNPDTSDPVQR